MGIITFTCPRCGTKRKVTPNTGFNCIKCNTKYSIGANGEIRSARPPKKWYIWPHVENDIFGHM